MLENENNESKALNKTDVSSCTAEFPFFGAKYPDARCIEGYLHDMDKCDENGNLYLMEESHPCPFCNREEFMQQQKDNEEDLEKVSEWINYINAKYNLDKVYQRLVDAGNGDCMKCTIATLLSLKYEEVPHFLEFESPNSEMINFMIDIFFILWIEFIMLSVDFIGVFPINRLCFWSIFFKFQST